MTSRKTMFGVFLGAASAVYRVTTESNVYILGFHQDRGRKYVVVRGLPGTDREHVVLRDSDPRVGQASMFELPPVLWVGQIMEIATMTSSVVTAVEVETDRSAITSVGGDSASAHNTWIQPAASREHAAAWAPRPAGMPEQPCAVPGLSRGTRPEGSAVASRGIAHNVVVGQSAALPRAASPAEPEVPYPRRHVMYAENAAAFLRSISRRDRLFDDLSGERELKARLYKALDDCAELLEQIRRRGRR